MGKSQVFVCQVTRLQGTGLGGRVVLIIWACLFLTGQGPHVQGRAEAATCPTWAPEQTGTSSGGATGFSGHGRNPGTSTSALIWLATPRQAWPVCYSAGLEVVHGQKGVYLDDVICDGRAIIPQPQNLTERTEPVQAKHRESVTGGLSVGT